MLDLSSIHDLILSLNIQQVRYERVNIDDIDTSSEDDDYGDLFSKDRGRITKGRSKIRTRKGCRYISI